jgi:hypothetical protein
MDEMSERTGELALVPSVEDGSQLLVGWRGTVGTAFRLARRRSERDTTRVRWPWCLPRRRERG